MQGKTYVVRRNREWRIALCLLTAFAVLTICTQSQAQVLIGSQGATWQNWNLASDGNGGYLDLNSNGAPYWDVPFLAFGNYNGTPADKSVGWCLTSTGDCQGVGSALFAPGTLPFWGMQYNAATDTGGAIDPKMFFRSSSGVTYQATLYLNSATNNYEINEFGWFETNSTGTVNGTKHVLFQGATFPTDPMNPGTPSPVGTVINFTPTQYFGFYYSDVSDEEDNNGPPHGCWAYTIFGFNDPQCTAAHQGDHVFAVFLQQVPRRAPVYWVAGQDPSMCNDDGDCNLTIVKIRRLPLSD